MKNDREYFFSCGNMSPLNSSTHFNPLSPDIHLKILQTDLHTFP